MDFSKLTYAEVQSMAERLNSSSTQMEELLTEIKGLFDKVGNDDVWSGTAASATKEQFDTLSAKFPEFSQSVNDCYTYLMSVVENYQSVDAMIQGQ